MVFRRSYKNRGGLVRTVFLLAVFLFISFFAKLTIDATQTQPFIEPLALAPTKSENIKRLAITFDDGPHPIHTPTTLDILDRYGASATFFVTGQNTLKYPKLVREIHDRGHMVGNHSYSHSREVHMTPDRIRNELRVTNSLIEDSTGFASRLYRAPFLLNADFENIYERNADSGPNKTINDDGFVYIGITGDTKDWQVQSREEVLAAITSLELEDGGILLYHDGGAEERYGVEALDESLAYLRDEGFTFVSLATLMGTTESVLMPTQSLERKPIQNFARSTIVGILSFLYNASRATFYTLLALVLLRIAVLIPLLYLARRRKNEHILDVRWKTSIDVLIPAYNEENNITGTILSALHSRFRPNKVIVVDDGSTDETALKVRGVQRAHPGKIKLIRVDNSGKANALNTAIETSKSEVVLCIDADTTIDRYAMGRLVRHFQDPTVAGVAGNVRIAQPTRFIERIQQLEYVVGQYIEKQALSSVGSISVVPGAIGAWRRKDLNSIGGYSTDTLVEDQDLTIDLIRRGKKVLYDHTAVAHTEVPHTVFAFLKQRFRWIYGTIQCLWKYKRDMFNPRNPRIGFLILPNIAIYTAIVPVVYPFIDISIFVSLFTGNFPEVLAMFIMFAVIDMMYSAIAVSNETNKRYMMLLVVPQRLVYRVLLSGVVIVSLAKAIHGTAVRWSSVEKFGMAQQNFLAQHPEPDTVD